MIREEIVLPLPKNCGHIKYISTNYSIEIGFNWQKGGTFIKNGHWWNYLIFSKIRNGKISVQM